MRGVADCDGALPLIELGLRAGYDLDAGVDHVPGARSCGARPTRFCRGRRPPLRYREEWLPHADWVELDGIDHCPQLDVPLETAQLILGFTSRLDRAEKHVGPP